MPALISCAEILGTICIYFLQNQSLDGVPGVQWHPVPWLDGFVGCRIYYIDSVQGAR